MLIFSDIGFSLPEENSFPLLVNSIMEKGKVVSIPKGRYLIMEDTCGAGLVAQVTIKNQIVGVLPYFKGESTLDVSIVKKVERSETELEGALHAWAKPEDPANPESGLYPFTFDIPDYYAYQYKFPITTKINLTAFSSAIPEIYTSEESYHEKPENHALNQGTKSFIPTGLFEADEFEGPASKALISGIIEKVEVIKNKTGKSDFIHLVTATLGGSVDMVISEELLSEIPQKGHIISGKFWLCGRVLND